MERLQKSRGVRVLGHHLLAVQLVRGLHADLKAREVPVAALHVGHREPPVVGLADLPAGAQSAAVHGWLWAPTLQDGSLIMDHKQNSCTVCLAPFEPEVKRTCQLAHA